MSTQISHWIGYLNSDQNSKKPVIVLLHGYGSNEEDLPGIMASLPSGLAWVSPRAPISLHLGSYAWMHIKVPGSPDPKDALEATEILWKWIDATIPETSPLIPIGFSQGGMMATQLLRTRPERILGTVVLAGFNVDSEFAADEQLRSQLPPVLYCYGQEDQVVSADAVERLSSWLDTHASALVFSYRRLGHSVDERVLKDVDDYLVKTLGVF